MSDHLSDLVNRARTYAELQAQRPNEPMSATVLVTEMADAIGRIEDRMGKLEAILRKLVTQEDGFDPNYVDVDDGVFDTRASLTDDEKALFRSLMEESETP